MKNLIQKATLVLGVAIIAFTACKKQDLNMVADLTSDETEIVALVEQAQAEMLKEDALAITPEEGVTRLDEGISADYLASIADFEETAGPGGVEDKQRDYIHNKSFIACLRKLELSDRQKEAIKMALAKYDNCKESAVKRAREIHKKLVLQYQAKFEKLKMALKNGDITEEQFKEGVHRLRMAFNKELRSLQLKDKLDVAFKNCYRGFLENVKEILTERQWKAFVECHKR